jgi:diguanylate cyclase
VPSTNSPGSQVNPASQAASVELQEEFEKLMEATYQTAKRLLPFMAKRRIPLTPFNYRLFYDYFEDGGDRLKERLDEILRNKTVLSPDLSERLYHEFYDYLGDRARKLSLMGEKIGSISQDLENNLEKTLDTTGHFRQFLSESASQMKDPNLANGPLKSMMANLLMETKSALNDQSDLADHIDSTGRVIAALTKELRDQTRLASVDELTQLFNRRYLTLQFTKMTAEKGGGLVLSMVLFDLDRFKNINDTYGHNIGDRVLLVCAKILQNHAEAGGHLACRYGGEEFVVMCPDLDLDAARELGDSVRLAVEGTAIQIRGNSIPVTISGGVSRWRPGEAIESFVDRADQALYRAKTTGRNRIVVEEEGV